MFFSIIVPTYNPNKYLPTLLDSICKNECKDELEVIISDDDSTEDYSSIIEEYSDRIKIISVKNDCHHGAPVYGRQNGINFASGKWICFADQDDWFTDNTFDLTKEFIENYDAKRYIITDLCIRHEDGSETLEEQPGNWTHGKFYERSFWNEYNITYEESAYCEDIGLSVKITSILAEIKQDIFYFNHPTYIWYRHTDSLSETNKYDSTGYLFKSFPDYIRITLGTYIDRYEKLRQKDFEIDYYYKYNFISTLFHMFFYFQGLEYNKVCKKIPKQYYKIINNYYKKFLKVSRIKNSNKLFDFIINDHNLVNDYASVRYVCYSQVSFIEKEHFKTWIKKIKWRSIF